MAELPNTRSTQMQSYIPGEITHAGATQAQSMMLESRNEVNNVYGRAFERNDDDAFVDTVREFQGGVFAGIMISPKEGPGTKEPTGGGDPYVPNGFVSRFIRIGDGVAVALDAAGENNTVGAPVFAKADGSLTTTPAAGEPIPAIVQWHKPAAEGPDGKVLATISLHGQIAQAPAGGDGGEG